MSEVLTPKESVRLCELERVIQKGKDTFVEVGTALAEIRDAKLYRPSQTFDEYCEKRWGFSKRSAYQFIAAAQVVENVRNCAQGEVPQTESQARPLTKLPAEQQPAAWEKAQEIAKEEGKPVAARHVEQAVAEVMPKEEPDVLVVDEATPSRRSPVRIIESEGMNIWQLAKSHLDRINKNDEYREKALQACIDYCQKRLDSRK